MRQILGSMVLMLVPLCFAARADDGPGDGAAYDFGDAVVVFTLEYEDDLLPPAPWALTGAEIRRLGNGYFLTGTEPRTEPGGDPQPAPARRHWIPLVDVVRMAEYDDVAAARRAVDLDDDGNADPDRPAARSVSRGPGRPGRGRAGG